MSIYKCVLNVTNDFSEHYKNYRVEEEIRSRVAELLRHQPKFKRTLNQHELVRVQFPVWKHPYQHFDIVILTENGASEFAVPYGDSINKCLAHFNSHAILEIKLAITPRYSAKIANDIDRLIEFITLKKVKIANLLLFLQGDFKRKNETRFKQYIEKTREYPNLKIFCAFRHQEGHPKPPLIYIHQGMKEELFDHYDLRENIQRIK